MVMNPEAIKNFIKQIHELWVVPEIARRNFTEPIYAILIVFKSGITEVLFYRETSLHITIDPSVGGFLSPGAPVTADELAKHKIKSIRVPEKIFANYGFIAAVTINQNWTVYFNFIPNKKEAREKLELAEEFIKAVETVNNEKVKAYNLFQALEQAVHATLLNHPVHERKIRSNKSHQSTKALVNIESKSGNIPTEISNLFNELFKNRSKIYTSQAISLNLTKENIDLVKRYIEMQKRIIAQ